MNMQQIMNVSGNNSYFVLIFFIAVPIFTLALNIISKPDSSKKPWNYIYSAVLHLVCIPGILSLLITLYTLLFLRHNLLMLNIATYYIPILSMFTTLILTRKVVIFNEIPGFKRISGFMIVIGITFISLIVIERTRIFVISSMQGFIILFVGLFFIIKYGIKMIFGDFKKEKNIEEIK